MTKSEFLFEKISAWKNGKKPYLSSNEAVVVWFCTGDKPKELPSGPPYIKFLHLTAADRNFINTYEKDMGDEVNNG